MITRPLFSSNDSPLAAYLPVGGKKTVISLLFQTSKPKTTNNFISRSCSRFTREGLEIHGEVMTTSPHTMPGKLVHFNFYIQGHLQIGLSPHMSGKFLQ